MSNEFNPNDPSNTQTTSMHDEPKLHDPQNSEDHASAAVDEAILSESDQVTKLEQELQEARDLAVRYYAEQENVRKRMKRDFDQQLKFATLDFANDLIEVVDNMSRAMQSTDSTNDVKSLLSGVRMIHQQFLNILQKHHCQPIAALGQPFDPNVHQAISQMPSHEVPAGHVALEASTGYRMHDRVIRPSQVIVSLGAPTDNATAN